MRLPVSDASFSIHHDASSKRRCARGVARTTVRTRVLRQTDFRCWPVSDMPNATVNVRVRRIGSPHWSQWNRSAAMSASTPSSLSISISRSLAASAL
jgi:hypothetical protein